MKLEMFHLKPYRELPEDFREQYHRVWVDVPNRLCDPLKSHELYNQSLDELEYAAALGFDGNYTQLRYVNIWPRPIQKPDPPISFATSGKASGKITGGIKPVERPKEPRRSSTQPATCARWNAPTSRRAL